MGHGVSASSRLFLGLPQKGRGRLHGDMSLNRLDSLNSVWTSAPPVALSGRARYELLGLVCAL